MKAISLDKHFEHRMRRAVWTHASVPRASLAEPRLRTALSLGQLAALGEGRPLPAANLVTARKCDGPVPDAASELSIIQRIILLYKWSLSLRQLGPGPPKLNEPKQGKPSAR